MMRNLNILFTLFLWLGATAVPLTASADQSIDFTLLFSANVKGELEPCG